MFVRCTTCRWKGIAGASDLITSQPEATIYLTDMEPFDRQISLDLSRRSIKRAFVAVDAENIGEFVHFWP